jgi:hypothetical protein
MADPRPLGNSPTLCKFDYIIIYLPPCIWSVAWVNALFSAGLRATTGIPGAPNPFRPGGHSRPGAAPPKQRGGELGTREVQKPCWVNGISPREKGICPRVCGIRPLAARAGWARGRPAPPGPPAPLGGRRAGSTVSRIAERLACAVRVHFYDLIGGFEMRPATPAGRSGPSGGEVSRSYRSFWSERRSFTAVSRRPATICARKCLRYPR